MDRGASPGRDMSGQGLLHPLHNRMRLGDGQSAINREVEIGMDLVAQPARPHLMDILNASDVERRVLDLGQDARFRAVQ